MADSEQANNGTTSDLLAIIEDCLNNYGSDVHLFQSPLTAWEVVKCRLPAGITSHPEQLARTVRAVLDDLIDALRSSESGDLNSPSVRRYIIADHLYRRGLKQTEICQSRLPLSKSQFYRERTETLLTLANYIQEWEQRTIANRKQAAIKNLAMLAPAGNSRLIGVDPLLTQLTKALSSAEGPKLIMLSGLGGLGKTAIAQAVVEQALHANTFHALGWVNCQRQRFTGTHLQVMDIPDLVIADFYRQLLRQLPPSSVSDSHLFTKLSEQVQDDVVTFDQVLDFLHHELDQQDRSEIPLSEMRSRVIDLLWAVPTLLVVDGLEAVPDAQSLIEELWHITSCTSAKVLILSRRRFNDCTHVKCLEVTPLANRDAIQLFKRYAAELGIEAVRSAPLEDLHLMINAAGGNPLIIKWIVNQLTAVPARQVFFDLAHGSGLSSDLYKFIYGRTWESLSASAQQVLIAIARSSGSTLTWEALQCDTELRPDVLSRSLQELVASSLVPVSASPEPFYEINAPTRSYVLAACHGVKAKAHASLLPGTLSTVRRRSSPVASLLSIPAVLPAKHDGKRSHGRSGN
jgi:hypothetical protein